MRRIFLILSLALPLAVVAQTPQAPPSPQVPSTPQTPPAPSNPSTSQAAPAPTATPTPQVPAVVTKPQEQLTVIRVNVTNQPWDFFRPWGKRAPYSRRAVGAVLPNNRVLVTAEFVANASYLEFETPDGSQKTPAAIEAVDYESNLALLKSDDPKFLASFRPLDLSIASVGDTLGVLQLETNGALLTTRGTMTNAEVSRYPVDETHLLVYHLAAALQFREAAFTVPVVKGDKLVGLVMRYDSQQASSDIVPTPVIEHFLRDAAHLPYKGVPKAGVGFAGTRDPQLRRYAGLSEQTPGGVYVTELQKDGPSEKAGLATGDVVLRIDDQPVDQDGNYNDPVYGRISLSNLLSTRHYDGDDVKFTVFRKGETKDFMVKLVHRPVEQYTIEPYVIDRAPKFYILGGLILEELSRQYLKEWGPEWAKKAPEDLVYIDRQQSELYPDGNRKVVFLSRVLPSDATVGYEDLHHLVITKINGVEINSLADVAGALEKATDGIHKIDFASEPYAIYLDSKQTATTDEILTKVYRLPSLKRLN